MIGKPLIVVGDVSGEDVVADILRGAGDKADKLLSGIDFTNVSEHKSLNEDVYDVIDKNPKELNSQLGNLCRSVDRGDSLLVVADFREADIRRLLKTILRRRATVNKGLLVIDGVSAKRLKQAKGLLDSKGLAVGKDVSVVVTGMCVTGAQGLRNLHRDCQYIGWIGLMDALNVVVYECLDEEEPMELYKVVHGFNGYGLLKM
ncbi:hypothetical protein ACTFR8_22870 [Bacillus cereus group sp. MYBK15-3]|uniref:hypothetical protein n=1 Tax=unclassified Bacillus cereus group TaxID=2750818 RepID=UPI003F7908DB